jgi:hypothetical protein
MRAAIDHNETYFVISLISKQKSVSTLFPKPRKPNPFTSVCYLTAVFPQLPSKKETLQLFPTSRRIPTLDSLYRPVNKRQLVPHRYFSSINNCYRSSHYVSRNISNVSRCSKIFIIYSTNVLGTRYSVPLNTVWGTLPNWNDRLSGFAKLYLYLS